LSILLILRCREAQRLPKTWTSIGSLMHN
jgi:hypothetical protein